MLFSEALVMYVLVHKDWNLLSLEDSPDSHSISISLFSAA